MFPGGSVCEFGCWALQNDEKDVLPFFLKQRHHSDINIMYKYLHSN